MLGKPPGVFLCIAQYAAEALTRFLRQTRFLFLLFFASRLEQFYSASMSESRDASRAVQLARQAITLVSSGKSEVLYASRGFRAVAD